MVGKARCKLGFSVLCIPPGQSSVHVSPWHLSKTHSKRHRQSLVENKKTVTLEGKVSRFDQQLAETKTDRLLFDGRGLRRLEQNLQKKSRCEKIASEGKKVMQF